MTATRHRRRTPRLPGIQVRSRAGIPQWVRAEVLALVRWLRSHPGVRDGLIVCSVPEPTIVTPDGTSCFGCFRWPHVPPHAEGTYEWIYLAAGLAHQLVIEGDTRDAAITEVLRILLHEFVHYLDWRDGKPPTERNVTQRADAMLRAYRAAPTRPTPEARP